MQPLGLSAPIGTECLPYPAFLPAHLFQPCRRLRARASDETETVCAESPRRRRRLSAWVLARLRRETETEQAFRY